MPYLWLCLFEFVALCLFVVRIFHRFEVRLWARERGRGGRRKRRTARIDGSINCASNKFQKSKTLLPLQMVSYPLWPGSVEHCSTFTKSLLRLLKTKGTKSACCKHAWLSLYFFCWTEKAKQKNEVRKERNGHAPWKMDRNRSLRISWFCADLQLTFTSSCRTKWPMLSFVRWTCL